MKFVKPFKGCRMVSVTYEVYPHEFQPGDECPKELEAAALSVGAVEKPKPKPKAKKAESE